MPRTVAVVDAHGNRYEATYPRRARGLVKKGRARFVAEDVICLTRPPEKRRNAEQPTMTSTITIDEIFERLNQITRNNDLFA